MKKLIKHFSEKQKQLLLIDCLGALITALSLFIIARNFNEYVGMPQKILTSLSLIALCFCIYSATCFFLLKEHLIPFIRVIAVANLLYCALSFGLLIIHYPSLTTIGITYFLIEIVIVCALSYIELNAVKNQ